MDWICVRYDNFGVMTKSVNKIKDIVRLNKPIFNEKYKVWVVRMKTKNGWKAVWRKQKDDANEVYEYLTKKIVSEVDDKKVNGKIEILEEQKKIENNTRETPKPVKENVLMKMFSKPKEKVKKVEKKHLLVKH